MYANTAKNEVHANTLISLIRLDSSSGIHVMQIAVMTRRLKLADPTIVPGPNSPGSKPFPMISMILRRISGAEEPSAMRVRLLTVSFQILTSIVSKCGPALLSSPPLPLSPFWFDVAILIFLVFDVITSMAAMKTSAIMFTPKNMYMSPNK